MIPRSHPIPLASVGVVILAIVALAALVAFSVAFPPAALVVGVPVVGFVLHREYQRSQKLETLILRKERIESEIAVIEGYFNGRGIHPQSPALDFQLRALYNELHDTTSRIEALHQ